MTTTASQTTAARTAVASLLAGDPPNGATQADLGEWREVYVSLQEAYAQDGTAAVRTVWDTICKAHPGAATLVASDDLPRNNTFANWRALALADITKPEPRAAVVPGLFYRSTVSIPFGAPGSLKSFVLADLAVCVAAGIPWLYPDPSAPEAAALCEYPTTQGPVVWVDFDNGDYTTRERFYALKSAYGLHRRAIPLFIYTMPTPWLDLSNETHAADFSDWLCSLPEKPVFTVIDNLSYISGGLSTNDDGMKNVMAALKHAAETVETHIEAIHHESKGSGIKKRAGERIRGSSAIEAGVDLALLFEREEGESMVKITAAKNRILRSFPTLGITLKTTSDDSDIMTMARCWQAYIPEGNSNQAQDAITVILTDMDRVNKTDLAKLVAARTGIGVNRARDIIAAMITDGSLAAVVDENARGKPIVCSLPE